MKEWGFFHVILLTCFFCACTSEDNEPDQILDTATTVEVSLSEQEIISKYLTIELTDLPNYSDPELPDHYGQWTEKLDNTPAYNPVSNMGAILGRVLFYDGALSVNGKVSCASCHSQETGFTDTKKASIGFDGRRTEFRSMRLANTRYFQEKTMFWERRATDLEAQSTQPIRNGIEMGFDGVHASFDELIDRMEERPYYPILFEKAFGSSTIDEDKIQLALSQFIRSMVSADSKFDQGYAQYYNDNQPEAALYVDYPNFTDEENLGKSLFMNFEATGGLGCVGCHQAPTFAIRADVGNDGLDEGETRHFKSSSLKNVAVTGPYMHDGRFQTLDQVVEHYNSGVKKGPNLDVRMLDRETGEPLKFNLSTDEKKALVAFLGTLTDEKFLEDKKFSDPFKDGIE